MLIYKKLMLSSSSLLLALCLSVTANQSLADDISALVPSSKNAVDQHHAWGRGLLLSEGKRWGGKHCSGKVQAPRKLRSSQLVLQVETVTQGDGSQAAGTGVIVQMYGEGAQTPMSAYALGTDSELAFSGPTRYRRTAYNRAIEKLTDTETGQHAQTQFLFTHAAGGTWTRELFSTGVTLAGAFTLTRSALPTEAHMAPESHAGTTVAFSILNTVSDLPPEVYPTQGVVLQSYSADGSYVGRGFGPGTIDHHGPYTYTKVSPNVAVERTTQIADVFTADYTMVYTYETPRSGTWYQNFAGGLIVFSGSFTTFDSE
ncbi:MAG: hypothetical protein COA42_09905 [Alteromonadaceae bacterium]|nr:MAG: hypothetical protein COA42_09905 [Alteromonadaceae bacterium]